MLVPDLTEKVDLVRAGEERCADRMHGRVAPPLVVKASVVIEVVKVRQIGFAPPELHIGYFKVVVKDTEVEVPTAVVRYELHRVAWHNIFGISAHEIFHSRPQRWERRPVVVQ